MPETVTISKERYSYLLRCEKVAKKEFSGRFSKKIERARRHIKHGKGRRFEDRKEFGNFLESL